MALSKASKPPLLFTTSVTVTPGAAPCEVTTAVGRRQWKVKEVLWHRDAAGATVTNIKLLLVDNDSNEFILFEDAAPSAATIVDYRIAPTLNSGEYFVDADAEVKLVVDSVDAGEVCDVRITGALVA